MATVFGTGALLSGLTRTANLPASTLAYAMSAWVKVEVDTNASQYFMSSRQATGLRNELRHDTATTNTRLRVDNETADAIVGTGIAFALNTWFYVALTTNGTNLVCYFWNEAGALVASNSTIVANSYAPDNVSFGRRSGGTTVFLQGKGEYIRCWNANLSQADFEAELPSVTAVRTVNLLWDWFEAADVSGNGRHPTATNVTVDADIPAAIVTGTPLPVFMNQYRQRRQ